MPLLPRPSVFDTVRQTEKNGKVEAAIVVSRRGIGRGGRLGLPPDAALRLLKKTPVRRGDRGDCRQPGSTIVPAASAPGTPDRRHNVCGSGKAGVSACGVVSAPEIFVTSPISSGPGTLPSVWPADKRVGLLLPLQDDGKLWSSRFGVRPNDADRGGGILDFMPKKAEGGPAGTIDVSNTSDIGAACRLLESEDTTFRGRVGGGLSQEYAGLAEGRRIPEVLMGVQVEHQMSERNKVLGAVEYARDVTDSARHRVRTQAAWEVLLDPDKNVSLRTGILESSNTAPNGEHGKNLDYSLDVIWKY